MLAELSRESQVEQWAVSELRLLTEEPGELRGQLSATDKRLTDDRESVKRLLAEKDERAGSLSEALNAAQRLVRQHVQKGKIIAQELIDERKSDG